MAGGRDSWARAGRPVQAAMDRSTYCRRVVTDCTAQKYDTSHGNSLTGWWLTEIEIASVFRLNYHLHRQSDGLINDRATARCVLMQGAAASHHLRLSVVRVSSVARLAQPRYNRTNGRTSQRVNRTPVVDEGNVTDVGAAKETAEIAADCWRRRRRR